LDEKQPVWRAATAGARRLVFVPPLVCGKVPTERLANERSRYLSIIGLASGSTGSPRKECKVEASTSIADAGGRRRRWLR
jgi:hypothetical protein